VFSRHNRLAFSEIVSYKADPSVKWLAITGLVPEVNNNNFLLTLSLPMSLISSV
jgi:hypothetical protein